MRSAPGGYKRGINPTEFDPTFFFRGANWEDLEASLEFFHENAASDGYTGTSVGREGDRVVLRVGATEGLFNLYEFDLSIGGNLLRFLTADDTDAKAQRVEWNYHYERIAGVWVPTEISEVRADPARDETDSRRFTWLENVVNEPVADDQFTPERAGVHPGDFVKDAGANVQYRYGSPEDPQRSTGSNGWPRKWMTWVVMAVVPAALIVAMVLVRRRRRRPT